MSSEQQPYAVQFTESAVENLRRYPKRDQLRIMQKIEQLAANPRAMRNVKRLVKHDVAYRLRVGDYRVLYEQDDIIRIIDIIDILPRSRAYRR